MSAPVTGPPLAEALSSAAQSSPSPPSIPSDPQPTSFIKFPPPRGGTIESIFKAFNTKLGGSSVAGPSPISISPNNKPLHPSLLLFPLPSCFPLQQLKPSLSPHPLYPPQSLPKILIYPMNLSPHSQQRHPMLEHLLLLNNIENLYLFLRLRLRNR
ncbi:hypothetical protein QJS04_geneDACA017532 [Acorus gramineus]|uniref:Uncharacterized protein n=1 Tax=Acorus gramineus TaxID=55184 RepID=A0AAV9BQL6_ACOGR|nr:hypothetical protein QJS04_geneDACA017532 [Acorus gramineus]